MCNTYALATVKLIDQESQRGQGRMENTVLGGLKRKASPRRCSAGGKNNECKGPEAAACSMSCSSGTREHLGLELRVKEEGGGR